ncbi:MAG TPA: CapA family protein [Methylomirabilota bacterium]|nr:CapA family protein [Methylomirabilota bacterium]
MKKNSIKIFLSAVAVLGIVMAFRMPKIAQSPASAQPAASSLTTTLFFAGDIMLSRNVDDKMVSAADFTLPFQTTAEVTRQADIAFANLESPFNSEGSHFVDGSLVFNADPKAIAGLKFAGFDILSTANNHTLDQGQLGLQYTYNLLKENGILAIGTTSSCHDGEVLTRNNIKFGFLAYSYTALNNGTHTTDPLVCDANDLNQVKTDISQLRTKVDVLIVSMHAGIEYTRTPDTLQKDFAQTASEAGADFVIGAHPHWIQKPIEKINNKTWVFYSLGNFIFDQMWSQDTREGLTLLASFSGKTLQKIELKPVIIDNFCCARWANDDETKNILEKLDLTSTTL